MKAKLLYVYLLLGCENPTPAHQSSPFCRLCGFLTFFFTLKGTYLLYQSVRIFNTRLTKQTTSHDSVFKHLAQGDTPCL